MAQRFVRDSIWTSPTINQLSDRAELLFYRLLPLPDDHGCFLADPVDLKGLLFPRKPKWTIDVIRRQLTSLLEAGLIGLWVQEERLYGIFWKWEKYQRCRSKFARKTPEPPKMENFSQKEHLDEVYKFLGFIDVNCRQLSSIGASSSSSSPSTSTSSYKDIVEPPKPGPPPSVKIPNPDHKEFITFFTEEYQNRFNVKYDFVGGRDGTLIKGLLKTFGIDLLKRIALEFFQTDDQFIKEKTGFTVPALKMRANQIAANLSRNKSLMDQLSPAGRQTLMNAANWIGKSNAGK